ncbi:MAG: Ig-like domain-containing protein [bacterium]|nr:MAG: Ig-like domain-containing protein [bacterium]
MKRFVLSLLLAVFLSSGAHAHEGMIALFTDHNHDDSDAVIELYEIKDIYLYYVRGYGPETIAGYQFRFLISSSDVLILNPEFPPGTLNVGNVNTCMQVVGAEVNMCTEWGPADAIYLGTIPVINYGDPDTFTVSVVEVTGYDHRLCVLLCEHGYPIYDVIGDMYLFNGSYDGIDTPTPPRLTEAKTATSMTVTAALNEAVTAATAEDRSNYEIFETGNPTQTISVSGAALGAGGSEITLTVSGEFIENQDYILRADGIEDLEGYDMRVGTWGTEIEFTAGDYVAVEKKSWGAIKSLFQH